MQAKKCYETTFCNGKNDSSVWQITKDSAGGNQEVFFFYRKSIHFIYFFKCKEMELKSTEKKMYWDV